MQASIVILTNRVGPMGKFQFEKEACLYIAGSDIIDPKCQKNIPN